MHTSQIYSSSISAFLNQVTNSIAPTVDVSFRLSLQYARIIFTSLKIKKILSTHWRLLWYVNFKRCPKQADTAVVQEQVFLTYISKGLFKRNEMVGTGRETKI